MSEMTARERIAETVKEAYDWGLSDATYNTNRAADRIIDIVREALLSEQAVQAVGKVTESRHYNADSSLRGIARGHPSTVITAALDAAFGADDDG